MNSQIYCLPQKFGWNAFSGKPSDPSQPDTEFIKPESPYFTVKFDCDDVAPEVKEELKKRYPKLISLSHNSDVKARTYVYQSETAHVFQPHTIYQKIKAPVCFERIADPVRRRKVYDPPFETLMPPGPGFHNDPDRGFYPWRCLMASSFNNRWKPMVRRNWITDVGARSTLPPLRLHCHDATQEKERWDYIRHLTRNDAVSYPYRRDVSGYTGHKQCNEHILSDVERNLACPNPAMESTTQAVHKEFANEDYDQMPISSVNKHRGPMSRMVTLTHPYNPFTQQSAYSHVGSTGTQ